MQSDCQQVEGHRPMDGDAKASSLGRSNENRSDRHDGGASLSHWQSFGIIVRHLSASGSGHKAIEQMVTRRVLRLNFRPGQYDIRRTLVAIVLPPSNGSPFSPHRLPHKTCRFYGHEESSRVLATSNSLVSQWHC